MIKSKIIILFLIFLFGSTALGKKEIDYTNKRVIKKIGKIIDKKNFKLLAAQKANSNAEHFSGKFFNIIENNEVSKSMIYIGRVNCCRTGGCTVERQTNLGDEYEYFDYFIIFDENQNVMAVKIFNYQATYGHEITSKSWLKQFIGYGEHDESLEVGKEIDAISGATISVQAITYDIQEKTDLLKSI
jgi:Na+-translocating ferredoxin:NAD+ oxidoreductase RnfG subunit